MRHIDKANIDEWLFDHFEGQLSFEEESQLVDFLDAHPEYRADLDHWANARVEEDEKEYPAMASLLMEEPVRVLAGAGATAGGFAAWQRWGAGIVAALGLLWMGYEFGNNDISQSGDLFPSDQAASISNNNNNNNIQNNGNASSLTDGGTLLADANHTNASTLSSTNENYITNYTHFLNGGSNNIAAQALGNSAFAEDGSQLTGNNGRLASNASNTNPRNRTGVNGSNNGGNGSLVQNGSGDPTSSFDPNNPNSSNNPINRINGINGNNPNALAGTNAHPNKLDGRSAPVVDEQAIATTDATQKFKKMPAGDGFFNDPNWARLLVNSTWDENGDGIRDEHEGSISYSDIKPTGIFPFRVPYKGVGFHNDNTTAFIVPNNNPLNINPALAGNAGPDLINFQTNARYQWADTESMSQSATFSYDQFIEGIGGGLGVIASHNRFNDGLYASSAVGVTYARQFEKKWKGKKDENGVAKKHRITITPAIKIGYQHVNLDESKLNETTTIEPERGYSLQISDNQDLNKSYGFQDIAMGVHVNAAKFYTGVAVDHLTSPVETLGAGEMELQRVPRKYTAYAGTEFKRKRESETVYRPSVLVSQQGKLAEIWLSQEIQMKNFVFGAGIASNGNVRGMLGGRFDQFGISYQYDQTYSEVLAQKKGSHSAMMTLQLH